MKISFNWHLPEQNSYCTSKFQILFNVNIEKDIEETRNIRDRWGSNQIFFNVLSHRYTGGTKLKPRNRRPLQNASHPRFETEQP